ncbi:DoxX family protein [Salinigranum salinum]|uniref:DoxX family protein n=1 Tax=Salinigranum salinum TaxID=1364937 RepID=UPI001260FD30|nr:DoxX family protein [Salinigranum salinum]
MAIETTVGGIAFLIGRVLFGAVLGFMGFNHFTQLDGMSGYAEAKGVPFPRLGVVASGMLLVFGGVAIVLGVYPLLGAAAIALFLLVSTPMMHDFWAFDDPEQQQAEMSNFLKNSALFGAALLIIAIGGTAWPYALNIGL